MNVKGSQPISRVLSSADGHSRRSRDNHSSTTTITRRLQQPTRKARGPRVAPCGASFPIWPCSVWGLPCRSIAELAVRSYRTISPLPDPHRTCRHSHRRYLSVALSVGSRRPAVNWHTALRSPDFPPPHGASTGSGGCLADSRAHHTPLLHQRSGGSQNLALQPSPSLVDDS